MTRSTRARPVPPGWTATRLPRTAIDPRACATKETSMTSSSLAAPRRRRRRAAALVLLAAALTACTSSSDAVSRHDCERLRDHLVDLRMSSVTADRDQHREALLASLGDDFVTTCVDQTSTDKLRCALDAHDAAGLRACTNR